MLWPLIMFRGQECLLGAAVCGRSSTRAVPLWALWCTSVRWSDVYFTRFCSVFSARYASTACYHVRMTHITISESTIRESATPDVFARGEQYLNRGLVTRLVLRGDLLLGTVEGSDFEPYRVRVVLEDGAPVAAECTCPYDHGGWCKHIVAVALAATRSPQDVEERLPLPTTLATLTAGQLRALLLLLSEQSPEIADRIEDAASNIVARPRAETGVTQVMRRTPPDPQAIKRRIRRQFQEIEQASADASPAIDALGTMLQEYAEQANRLVRHDPRTALLLLEATFDESMNHWTMLKEYGNPPNAALVELIKVLTEAILTAELSSGERQRWVERIEDYHDTLHRIKSDRLMHIAHAAASQGWTYPPLRRVLQGNITPKGAWEHSPPHFADELANIRLNILERQGKLREFMFLAEAEGQLDRYTQMLAKTGDAAEAAQRAIKLLDDPNELLAVAQALRERKELRLALDVAQTGLQKEGNHAALAAWVSDVAAETGNVQLASETARQALTETPSYEHYVRVRTIAGADWPRQRRELLRSMRDMDMPIRDRVQIYLDEELYEAAMRVTVNETDEGVLRLVMNAVREHHPDWATVVAQRAAERLIALPRPPYEAAIDWLRRARDVANTTQHRIEWQHYIKRLKKNHWRKERLVNLLSELEREPIPGATR